MTPRSKTWQVVAGLFFFINFAGAVFAAAQGELLHAGVHVGLLLLGADYVRRVWRRGESVASGQSRELTDSLTQLEQSVAAVGIEVERLGEGQRFITRLFTEKGTPQALGDGAADPSEIKVRKPGPQ